jgi:hypothetical protein
MIPAVPYIVRLWISTVLMAIGLCFALAANWITPEAKRLEEPRSR